MSKASLNMLTRTCGIKFALRNVFMTSVDTGWVSSDMIPMGFLKNNILKLTPLDEIDGASRVLDPIFMGLLNN